MLREWDWKEHFAGQPETERYLNHVADKFDLRKDIQFNIRVVSARFDEGENRWEIATAHGGRARARFLIAAVDILSAHHLPDIPGLDDFKGEWHHTARWPHRDPDLAGKRVGAIGTGATAVQLITEIAPVVGRLSVFQRTPNYCAPLRNGPIDAETQRKIKAGYPEIFRRIRRRPPLSFMTSTRARCSRCWRRSGWRGSRNCGRSRASRSGSATSATS